MDSHTTQLNIFSENWWIASIALVSSNPPKSTVKTFTRSYSLQEPSAHLEA
jgi:hypothetical protein